LILSFAAQAAPWAGAATDRLRRYSPRCKVVNPRGLLIQLVTKHKIRLRHVAGYAIDAFRDRNKPKSPSPLEDLVTFGRHLEKTGQYQSDPPNANKDVHRCR